MRYLLFFTTFIFTICFHSCKLKNEKKTSLNFKEKLELLFPGVTIDSLTSKDHFKSTYRLSIQQNLDPANPEKGTFNHTVYISHFDDTKPTVFITDGYDSYNRTTELSKIFKSNQVIVEYRMYGSSRPNPIPWEYLTNNNAIEDYHLIVSKLKTIYKGKWISSGISKGGETTLIYKSKYPDDIDVAIPYVAPLINGTEDQRTTIHINTVGTKLCRDKITTIQRAILQNRLTAINEFKRIATENELTFTEVPIEEALEYAVLEFPFSFWQWDGNCENLPDETSISEVMNYVHKVVGLGFYSDKGYNKYLPSFYQHMQELGYYGFDFSSVKDLLKKVTSTSNIRFAPKDATITYNPNYIKKVRDYAETKGNKILYIYGENDPWYACAPNPAPDVDALKMVLKNGNHSTRIKHFSIEQQNQIYDKLQKWLGSEIEIYKLYNN